MTQQTVGRPVQVPPAGYQATGYQSLGYRTKKVLLGPPLATSRLARPLLENPARVLAIAALTAAVLTGGLYAGFELRRRRLGLPRNPYKAYEKEEVRDTDTGTDYGAVGI